MFGLKPKRPAKGCIVDTGNDFTAINELMPHPIYGWMSWVQILSPSESSFASLLPLLSEAHSNAIIKFNKKTVNKYLHRLNYSLRSYFSNEQSVRILKMTPHYFFSELTVLLYKMDNSIMQS